MNKSKELPSNRQTESVLPTNKGKQASFTQISNEVLLDQRLSFKARGILALLLSRPTNWKIYIDEIVERSDADGKHSVRTGFKELKDLGYIQLVKVWNDETGKFEGTVYQLCLSPIEPIPSPSLKKEGSQTTVLKSHNIRGRALGFSPLQGRDRERVQTEKPDQRKISTSENPSDEKADRPKTMTPSNTNSSNTKHSNTEIQQQQATIDDDAFLKNNAVAASAAACKHKTAVKTTACPETSVNTENQTITDFLPYLQDDDNWKKQFVGKQIGNNVILTTEKFDLLLRHFAQTSISIGTTYKNVAAIKRHFFNWFNANLNKGALSSYIEQQTVLPKKTRKQVKTLMPKTDAILNKIYGQQCDNEAHLYRCLQILATHSAVYENALQFLEKDEKIVVNTWFDDIQKVNNLVERGQKAGKLTWFCAKKMTLHTKPRTTTKQSVNNAITGLSQRFMV